MRDGRKREKKVVSVCGRQATMGCARRQSPGDSQGMWWVFFGRAQSSGRRDRSHAGPGRRSEEAKRNEASS